MVSQTGVIASFIGKALDSGMSRSGYVRTVS